MVVAFGSISASDSGAATPTKYLNRSSEFKSRSVNSRGFDVATAIGVSGKR